MGQDVAVGLGWFSLFLGCTYIVVIAPMIMKFGTGVMLIVFYTMVTKNCNVTTITSL